MDDKVPEFSSAEEETKYWRELSKKLTKEKDEIQQEFDEFYENSKLYEKELESNITSLEKKNKDLVADKTKIDRELDSIKSKLDQSNRENIKLQQELDGCRTNLQTQLTYIRELEQKNDDLERAQRVYNESIQTTEHTLNSAIERNALLESEMDEKEQLKIKIQRLLDETRDLKHELNVKEKLLSPDNDKICINNGIQNNNDNKLKIETQTQTSPNILKNGEVRKLNNNIINNNLHSQTRMTALNIVSEILEKIGILEAKIAENKLSKPHLNNIHNSYRDNLINRQLDSKIQSTSLHQQNIFKRK